MILASPNFDCNLSVLYSNKNFVLVAYYLRNTFFKMSVLANESSPHSRLLLLMIAFGGGGTS